jgi:hypothetical protein
MNYINRLDLLYDLCSEAWLPHSDFVQRVNKISESFAAKESKVMSEYKDQIIVKYKQFTVSEARVFKQLNLTELTGEGILA